VTLVCFAVKEEARPFQERLPGDTSIKILLTGMGPANAQKAVRAALSAHKPNRVFTCGFAGALNPDLTFGTVVFDPTDATAFEKEFHAAGAKPGRFHCSPRVAATAAEKQALRTATGADAVEMESGAIAEICREQGIPCITVRVVLDTAGENLPLDFNQLMTAGQQINFARLIWTVLKSPGKISALLRLQRQSRMAAEKLASILPRILTKNPTESQPEEAQSQSRPGL
jgi:adenosylhomocysteine nucleosidase